MSWLQPFVKAAGMVPWSCCYPADSCLVQLAWASREGRGEELQALGGPEQRGPQITKGQRQKG